MSHDLTWWIEDAEARRFRQAAAFERSWGVPARHHEALGEAIAKVPAWFHAPTRVGYTRLHHKR
jgi:hypothetical protein